MSAIITPFHELGVDFGAPYRLGYPEGTTGPSRRIYPAFCTKYMQESGLLVIFAHCYYLKMRKESITTEYGRSLFATVHGVRYIQWMLVVQKLGRQFKIQLVRQTNCDIKGEYRVQFYAQSRNGKNIQSFRAKWYELLHRVEFIPDYGDILTQLYQSDEFCPGLLKIEVRLGFALRDFQYIVPEIDTNPLLRLRPQHEADDRIDAIHFITEINLSYYVDCTDVTITCDRIYLYISCRYFHDLMDSNPNLDRIDLPFNKETVIAVLSFAFSGICRVRYEYNALLGDNFLEVQNFLACLNLLKPLMYRELLQMFDERCCRIFQKECATLKPPCTENTMKFLELAIKWGFPKLEHCAIARIVCEFPYEYYIHLNAREDPHVIERVIKARMDYEMFTDEDLFNRPALRLSPLEKIELLKAKCSQVLKAVCSGLTTDLPEPPSPPPLSPPRNLLDIPILRKLFTKEAMEELD